MIYDWRQVDLTNPLDTEFQTNRGIERVNKEYMELTRLIERLHRRFLDVLRVELTRMGIRDLNGVQALLLSNIGTEEIVIRDLIERGYYQGSNVSYNIKKMTEMGYLEQRRAEHDKRSVSIKLTPKAIDVVAQINKLQDQSAVNFEEKGVSSQQADDASNLLRLLERTWTDYIHYGDG